jgi:hypothetical protein
MVKRACALLLLGLLATCGLAKDKTKNILPAYVLQAKTVAVVIDPKAGMSIDDPRANEMAQKDVEAAFLKWGRFEPVSDAKTADLIVMVRKGHGRLMDDTMPDARQNSSMDPANRQGSAWPAPGAPPNVRGDAGSVVNQRSPQADIGDVEDSFSVFKGGENPRYARPVWNYTGRDGLNPQNVAAVAAFKRAVTAAEKAVADKP